MVDLFKFEARLLYRVEFPDSQSDIHSEILSQKENKINKQTKVGHVGSAELDTCRG